MPTVNTLELKRLRKLKKAGQQAIADYLDMPLSTYANKENKGDFDEREILMLATYFKIDKSRLTDEETNSNELLIEVNSLMTIQRAQMELLLYLVESDAKVRNVASEILNKYGIGGMFADRHKLSKA